MTRHCTTHGTTCIICKTCEHHAFCAGRCCTHDCATVLEARREWQAKAAQNTLPVETDDPAQTTLPDFTEAVTDGGA